MEDDLTWLMSFHGRLPFTEDCLSWNNTSTRDQKIKMFVRDHFLILMSAKKIQGHMFQRFCLLLCM